MTTSRYAFALLFMAVLSQEPARAQEPEACDIPSYLVIDDNELGHVAKVAKDAGRIDVLVVGTGSSALPAANGGNNAATGAYPARLEAALRRRLPKLTINVATEIKSRQSAAGMAQSLEKLIQDHKPALVVWQTGTFDAMHGIDPDEFRAALDRGVDTLKASGTDVILMNMQYSPRTESIIAVGPYADNMRLVARERDVLLFDRLSIMRYWNDAGAFDLNAAGRDAGMAQQVHDCLGRALASLVIGAAHLSAVDVKPSQ